MAPPVVVLIDADHRLRARVRSALVSAGLDVREAASGEAGADPTAAAAVVADRRLADETEDALLGSERVAPMYTWPRSPAMRDALAVLERASTEPAAPVLLAGPAGAGKHRAAELYHRWCHPGLGPGGRPPLVQVDCTDLGPRSARPGAATNGNGAGSARSPLAALFDVAQDGTLVLEEIAGLWPGLQAPLLDLLEGREAAGAAGRRVRVVAMTRRDPDRLADDLDPRLLARLTRVAVRLPPLRERIEDVAPLAEAFVRHFAARLSRPVSGLAEAALTHLISYDFPGEVRELRTIIGHATKVARGPLITERDLARALPEGNDETGRFFTVRLGPGGAPPPVSHVERQYALRVLRHCAGRRTAAAQLLGLSYPTFLKWLRDLGLD